MHIYIALLRGINVGGRNKVPMVELRALLTEAGLDNVTTYIQSGNVVFQSLNKDTKALEELIHNSIFSYFGLNLPILVKTRNQLSKIFNDSPFENYKKVESYFVILNKVPCKKLVLESVKKTYPEDEYHIINDCIYLYCKKGYGRSKFNLSYFEKKLKVNATARNYKTMVKLLSLSDI